MPSAGGPGANTRTENDEESEAVAMARLREKYREDVLPQLMSDFNYKNVMQAPKLEKIVVNIGLGESIQNAKALDAAVRASSYCRVGPARRSWAWLAWRRCRHPRWY